MKWLSTMFSPKSNKGVSETASKYPVTYSIGWEIYTKDGARFSHRYEEVKEENSKATIASVQEEVAKMHAKLEEASKEGKTFVNLEGTVLRVADVTKVTVCYQQTT